MNEIKLAMAGVTGTGISEAVKINKLDTMCKDQEIFLGVTVPF